MNVFLLEVSEGFQIMASSPEIGDTCSHQASPRLEPAAFEPFANQRSSHCLLSLHPTTSLMEPGSYAGRCRPHPNAHMWEFFCEGQTEGQVHNFKLLKRQMSGRAGFALLRKRVLLAAWR